MAYFLGIDIGAARTVAAVAHPGSDDVETVDLDEDTEPDTDTGDGIVSVLHLGVDGVLAVGAVAQGWALTDPDRVVSGFPGRIGDDAMLLAGEPWAPEELTAWLVRWVVDRVAEREGGPATAVAVSHPASWDAHRTRLLADAVAEQELDVAFLAPPPDGEPAAGADDRSDEAPDGRGAGAPAARRAARALRTAATVTPASGSIDGSGSGRHTTVGRGPAEVGTAPDPVDGAGSGRHVVVGGAIAALAGAGAPPAVRPGARAAGGDDTADPDPDEEAGRPDGPFSSGAEAGADRPVDSTDTDGTDTDGTDTDGPNGTDGRAADDPSALDGDRDPDDPSDDAAGGRAWDVPAPRSPESGHPADPATKNLVADLVGFTGGMGATNTAGLLSGYTPPHGTPALWSGGPAGQAGAAPAGTATATGGAVALPAQRSGSGGWTAVAPEDRDVPAADDQALVAVPRARTNPTVLVGAGGLAAAVAVVATLFLWPAPRTTNTATRPVAAVPAVTAEPSAPTVPLTPTAEPTPTRRPRPAAPRTRRPVVPPVTASPSASDTTPTDSTEPTEPTTSPPPSTEPTEPTTSTTTTTTTTKANGN